MSGQETDGRAESIRQRLRNELRARGQDVSLGLPRYAVERFLYRLGRSRHRERFVLKGATLFAIWFRISTALSEIVVGTVAQLIIGAAVGTNALGS